MAVGDSSVSEGRISVHAHTKHNIDRGYAYVIVSYSRTVVPLNRTRLNKGHDYRRVCMLVMYVYDFLTFSFLKLVIVDYLNKLWLLHLHIFLRNKSHLLPPLRT